MCPVQTSFESPWQNGIAERRDLLDHVIALNERHLKRLLTEYVSYHHEDHTHWGFGKETPGGRQLAPNCRKGAARTRKSDRVWPGPDVPGLHPWGNEPTKVQALLAYRNLEHSTRPLGQVCLQAWSVDPEFHTV